MYVQKQLQFKPPLESLRSKYYVKLRSFLSFPGSKFVGFAEDSSGKKVMSRMQKSPRPPVICAELVVRALPCILVTREAALAPTCL